MIEKKKVLAVLNVPKGLHVTVEECFEALPFASLGTDRDGRKQEIKTTLLSCSGKHVVCRDIGATYGRMYWDDFPVEKVVFTRFEVKIYLRRLKKVCFA